MNIPNNNFEYSKQANIMVMWKLISLKTPIEHFHGEYLLRL